MPAPRSFTKSVGRIFVVAITLHCAGVAFAQAGPPSAAERPMRDFEPTQVAAVSIDREIFPVRRGEVVVTRLADPLEEASGDGSGAGTSLMLLVTLVLIARIVKQRA